MDQTFPASNFLRTNFFAKKDWIAGLI
jgi:hypothetical protein